MSANGHAESGARAAPALAIQLERPPLERHGIVASDDPLFLMTEDLLDVRGAERHKGARGIPGRPAERRVMLRHKAIAQIRVVGPFRALVGPNGSGKTTFLDVIVLLGDLMRNRGEVRKTVLDRSFSDQKLL
jgi:hypothetical protein